MLFVILSSNHDRHGVECKLDFLHDLPVRVTLTQPIVINYDVVHGDMNE